MIKPSFSTLVDANLRGSSVYDLECEEHSLDDTLADTVGQTVAAVCGAQGEHNFKRVRLLISRALLIDIS